jgi:D-amino-acid oxidase
MAVRHSRRSAMQLFALGAAGVVLDGCAPRQSIRRPGDRPSGRPLARVLVSADRIIRQVAGLRPFRRSGFNVTVQALGDKTLIHNYGHGGGGITLSWGTADLVAERALATPHRDAAVVGCGAVGLATARLLQDRGFTVTIYARDLPPQTTSNIAGAYWSPYLVFDNDRRTPEFDSQYARAARFAWRYFQNLAGPTYGVWWRESYSLAAAPPPAGIPPVERGLLAGLRPSATVLPPGQHPFGNMTATRSMVMHIEPSAYLHALVTDFRVAGGRVVVREIADPAAMRDLPHPLIVNCTGLAAGKLFNDPDVLPIKGQLTVLAPQAEVDYLTFAPGDLYMMPRRDGIVLGGTSQRDVWSLDPDPDHAERIFRGHRELYRNWSI